MSKRYKHEITTTLKEAMDLSAKPGYILLRDIRTKDFITLHDQSTAFDDLRKRTAVDCHVCRGWGFTECWTTVERFLPLKQYYNRECYYCQGETQLCAFCSGNSKTCECNEEIKNDR